MNKIFVSDNYQKRSECCSICSKLRYQLPKRITCPLILTTSYTDENGREHKSEAIIKPKDPSYNLE